MIKIDYKKILYYLIIVDLLLSGVGRIIVLGPLTGRTILFVFATISWLIPSFMHGFKFSKKPFLLITAFLFYLILNILVVGDAAISIKIDFFLRYAFLLMVFYFENYYNNRNINIEIIKIKKLFKNLTLLFAAFSILLWIYVLIIGLPAYNTVELGFFRPYAYGRLDFIGGRIPRIFMKTSVFIPIGMFFFIDDYFREGKKTELIGILLHVIALITTFTTGFWLFSVVCVAVIFIKRGSLNIKRIITFILGIVVLIIANLKLDFIGILESKYSGNYTSDNRLVQVKGLFREFLGKPLFGYGFGHKVAIVYNGKVRETDGFEIAYGELLVDTGIIGIALFLICIAYCLFKMFKQAKHNEEMFIFAMGIVFICLQSLTNPYINNSIGLTYLGLCVGMSNALSKKNYIDSKLIKDLMDKFKKSFKKKKIRLKA
jgi:hypothetical protein